jgi:hypothetical protein
MKGGGAWEKDGKGTVETWEEERRAKKPGWLVLAMSITLSALALLHKKPSRLFSGEHFSTCYPQYIPAFSTGGSFPLHPLSGGSVIQAARHYGEGLQNELV